MGYGAFLAMQAGFINTQQLDRIMKLISKFELSLWHPIMDSAERIWGCNEKIIAKRGGFLCAPVPCGEIGSLATSRNSPSIRSSPVSKSIRRFARLSPAVALEWTPTVEMWALRTQARW